MNPLLMQKVRKSKIDIGKATEENLRFAEHLLKQYSKPMKLYEDDEGIQSGKEEGVAIAFRYLQLVCHPNYLSSKSVKIETDAERRGRPRRNFPKEEVEKVVAGLTEGRSVQELSRSLLVPVHAVEKIRDDAIRRGVINVEQYRRGDSIYLRNKGKISLIKNAILEHPEMAFSEICQLTKSGSRTVKNVWLDMIHSHEISPSSCCIPSFVKFINSRQLADVEIEWIKKYLNKGYSQEHLAFVLKTNVKAIARLSLTT